MFSTSNVYVNHLAKVQMDKSFKFRQIQTNIRNKYFHTENLNASRSLEKNQRNYRGKFTCTVLYNVHTDGVAVVGELYFGRSNC